MKNKVLRERSKCVVCRSSKTRFLKQKHNSKKNQIVFQITKIMQIYCQTCKKHTGNTFPKKLALVSKNKIKGKSKCTVCLTERNFIYEIEDKCDLESELEIYLQFFTDLYYKKNEALLPKV